MRGIIVAALCVALAGCGTQKADQPDGGQTAQSDSINNYQQAVINLNDASRRAVLFRAIRDAGLPCQNVIQAERLPDEKEGPVWRAQCEDKSYHLVIVRADGTAYVVSRTR
ncbi:MAG: hypothetical protein CMN72_01460 [Sphingomonas sp.]|nr:hypothetical protein [Sphingomonas sp.]